MVVIFFMIFPNFFLAIPIIGSRIYHLFTLNDQLSLYIFSAIAIFPEYILKIFTFKRFNQYLSSVKISPLLPLVIGVSASLISLITMTLILAMPSSVFFVLITHYVILFFLCKSMVSKINDSPQAGSSKVKRNLFKLVKFSAQLTILLTVLGIIGYYSFMKEEIESQKAVNLNDVNYVREGILAPDSENRGYSDKAKEYMEEDLRIFNNDENMRKWYTNMLIYKRKIILSETKDAYVKNFLGWSKNSSCLLDYKNKNFKDLEFKHYLSPDTVWETKKKSSYSSHLSRKYEAEMTYDEIYSMMNENPTDQECLDYLQ